MTTPITKELREHAEENVKALRLAVKQHAFKDIRDAIEMDLKVAEFALAAMDAEPYGFTDGDGYGMLYEPRHKDRLNRPRPLYAAPPAPVVPDAYIRDERGRMMLNGACEPKIGFGAGWNACRASMLNHSEDEHDMVQLVRSAYKLPERVTNALTLSLQAMEFMGDTLNNLDAVCEEDVEFVAPAFEAVRAALAANSPVIPDGWVAVRERVPEVGQAVLAYRPDAPESDDPLIKMTVYTGKSHHGFNCYCTPSHWMPLPAAPQREGM